MATATVITLTAGGLTFTNEWYQTKRIDWKVPLATVVLAAGVDMLSELDNKAAILLSVLILMGAVTTKFNGKSVVNLLSDFSPVGAQAKNSSKTSGTGAQKALWVKN